VIDELVGAQDVVQAVDQKARLVQSVDDRHRERRWPEGQRDPVRQDFKECVETLLEQRNHRLFVGVKILLGAQEPPEVHLFDECQVRHVPFDLGELENGRLRPRDLQEEVRESFEHVLGQPIRIFGVYLAADAVHRLFVRIGGRAMQGTHLFIQPSRVPQVARALVGEAADERREDGWPEVVHQRIS